MEKHRLIRSWENSDLLKNKNIIKAFKKIKRENFILPKHKNEAYYDIPLPIPEQQTISQPTTIALMLDYLDIKENNKILEIGTGSGYNAALLSRLTKNKIISIERIEKLVDFAENNLKKSRIKNVEVIHHDGNLGYEKEAPYDRIIVTCSCDHLLDRWIEQLKENGILVAPVGYFEQEMIIAKKVKRKLEIEKKGFFRFVPLVSGKE